MDRLHRNIVVMVLLVLAAVFLSACNLGGAPEPSATPTATPTVTPTTTGTVIAPTPLPLTQVAPPTSRPPTSIFPPTSVAQVPTATFVPVTTPQPVRIVILSPPPGSVVAGSVLVVGTAIHPQFLQYQLEFGPDPNPGNLWYPINVSSVPVTQGVLGTWSTFSTQDGIYQLRLRVVLRDGTQLSTVVGNIRVQNRAPTPVPTATPSIPRPIAAFSMSTTSGQAPLNVRFINQSAGNITEFVWNFGDGTTSREVHPIHTYNSPGLYTVTLTAIGPGGTSNVSSQVNVTSANPPVAAFSANPTSGPAPLTVQFTNQSVGQVSSYLWYFGDGTTSTEINPRHTFSNVGTYNVILQVVGPGGSSTATRQITVVNPQIPAPRAAFTLNPASGLAPLTVQFTNQSTGNITNYIWNFGDGTLSTDVNPSHQYLLPGTYVVTLLASGPGGLGTAQATVVVNAPPTFTPTHTATFTLTPTLTETPLQPPTDTPTPTETPTETETAVVIVPTDTPTDTPTSTETPTDTPTPTPTFTETATETPTLTPTATETATDVPTETPLPPATDTPLPAPVATFVAQQVEDAPLTVQFDSSGSQNAVAYQWDFGDGQGSNEPNPRHTYAQAGQYIVTLTVTGQDGRTDTTQQQITVSPPAPVAAFNAQQVEDAPLTVQFDSSGSQNAVAYQWDFGDGQGSNEPNPRHTYAQAGQYIVTLTVTGQDGRTDTTQREVTVQAPAPVAAFNAQQVEDAPLTVQFDSSGSQNAAAYQWDFGDGQGGNEPNPRHTYAQAGQYVVTLTVTSADGRTDTTQREVTVQAPAPVASFVAQQVEDAPLTVQFDSSGSQNAAAYQWDFGDGQGSNEPNPRHTYAQAGQYVVTLTVTSADGRTDTTQREVTVQAPAPVAAFNAQQVEDAPLTVQFDSSGSQNAAAYQWDFGDGQGSNEPNPRHTYAQAGQYVVTLTVTSADGRTDTTQREVTVQAPAPVAAFNAQQVEDAPLTVQFDSSGSQNAAAYQWDFGDGQGSNEPNPRHTYAQAGQYVVTLTVTSADGRTDTTQREVTVQAPAPVAAFNAQQVEDAPLTVQFDSSGSQNAVAYQWDFGDGQGSNEPNPRHTYAQAGQYIVTLTVTGQDGRTDTTQQEVAVTAPEPTPTPVEPETPSLQPVLTLQAHDEPVNAVAYSPDGGRIATGARDGVLIIWDGATGQPQQMVQGHADEILSLAWSGNNATLATGGADDVIHLWSAAAGQDVQLVGVLEGHTGDVNAVAWSPDQTRVASASADGTVRIWDVATGDVLATLQGHVGAVLTVAWSFDGTLLASGGEDNLIYIWDVTTGMQLTSLQGHTDDVRSVAWRPNSFQVASGSADGTVRLWDATTATPLAVLDEHEDAVNDVVWSAGLALASSGDDGVTYIWNVNAQAVAETLEGHTDEVLAASWRPDGVRIATAGADNLVLVWEF